MVKCCLCGNSGVCKNCRCVQNGQPCTNCNQQRFNHCHNWDVPGAKPTETVSGNSTSLARSLSSQPTSSTSSSSSLSALSLSSSSSSQALVLPSRCSPTSAGEQVSRLGDFSGGERVNIDPGDLASGVNGTFNADNDLDEGGNVALAQLQQRSENSEPLATNRCLDYDFTWNDVCGEAFTASLKAAYGEVVHWRRNIFMVPSGKVGKECA